MAESLPRLTGLGFSVPANIRTNNDPIFDYLQAHGGGGDLFQGYNQRHILAPGEDLMTMMLPAAQNALSDAGLFASDIDLLIGMGSISPYATPNELCLLHQLLGLPESCPVVPLNREFSGFNCGVLMADALIRVGRAKNVLVVAGANWTRHVSYQTPQSISAGDAAGAAVVSLSSDGSRWTLLDDFSITQTKFYGTMFMQVSKGKGITAFPKFRELSGSAGAIGCTLALETFSAAIEFANPTERRSVVFLGNAIFETMKKRQEERRGWLA